MHDFVQPYRDHSSLAVSIYHEGIHAQHVIVRAQRSVIQAVQFLPCGYNNLTIERVCCDGEALDAILVHTVLK